MTMPSYACRRTVVALALLVLVTGCHRLRERVLETRAPLSYLLCPDPAKPAAVTATIGPEGGFLTNGRDTLTIEPNALPQPREMTMTPVAGDSVGVSIEPGGPLRRVAILSIDMSRCSDAAIGTREWSIFRNKAQRLWTDIDDRRRAGAALEHTSGFMIAN